MDDELKFGIHNHWTLFFTKDSIMAFANVGAKTLLVFYTDKEDGIKCSVQVRDPDNRVYYAHVENGKRVEKSFEDQKEMPELTTKDLKVYASILYTLPEKLKDAIAPLL
jgi:hypothetical protein